MTHPARFLFPALLAAVLLFPAGEGRAQQEFGLVSTVQLPEDQKVEEAALADFDGNGTADLVVATHVLGRPFERWIRIHLRRPDAVCFATAPDHALRLHADVIAFCPGDVGPAPGAEIVLFTATGAFAWRRDAGEKDLPVKIASGDFLWQISHPREPFLWRDGVRDVDGDGLPDLLLPEADGYRLFFQARDEEGTANFDRTAWLEVPDSVPAAGRTTVAAAREKLRDLRTSLSLGEDEGAGDLLSVREHVPYPVFADFDADGRDDLLAQTDAELLVWLQGEGGVFASAPDRRLPLPVEIDTGRRLDVSFSAHARDLDGDGCADYVIVAGDRRSQEARTQVLVYTHAPGRGDAGPTPEAPLFGPRGIPRQPLFLLGFAGLLDLADVNGDGLPDLVMGSVRVDALDAIRAATSGDLDADLVVYLNQGGTFSRKPDLSFRIPIPAKNLRGAGKTVTARFLGDLTGTGAADLLLRDDPERLRLMAVRRTGGGLSVFPRPLFETRVEKRAKVRIEAVDGGSEVLVLESQQVRHVRFQR